MQPILNLNTSEIATWLTEHGQPKYRAKQIERWIYQRRVQSFEEMTDLPQALRSELAAHFELWTTKIIHDPEATDGTQKLLLQLHDGQSIECVLIKEGARRTVCMSTQVGCGMGCVFCASGLDGVARNLTTGEMFEQLLCLQHKLAEDERLTHVVVMGMGEPLANLNQLLPVLNRVSSPEGFGISARRITVSTVGLPKAIHRLADLQVPYHLAISLHAPNDELRDELVKMNQRTGMDAILDAADHFFEVTGRRVTFEYVLLAGKNDRPEHAQELAKRLRGKNILVNLIPYNPVAGLPYQTPRVDDTERFQNVLTQYGVQVQVRKRKGDRIDAACGQLRRNREQQIVTLSKPKRV
ncbi:putative dual-specificity RNA methyltransferase RlmN [Planctomycetales bacterium 10988]|nr:putative dual-specificity RNA methyltransferase RlmN [Planctomycetales bacterium 10988]